MSARTKRRHIDTQQSHINSLGVSLVDGSATTTKVDWDADTRMFASLDNVLFPQGVCLKVEEVARCLVKDTSTRFAALPADVCAMVAEFCVRYTVDTTLSSIGTLKSVVRLRGSQLNGLQERFHHNGVRMSAVNYLDGVKHGTSMHWWRTGLPKKVCSYTHGERDGIYRRYNPAGAVCTEFNYVNGHLVGQQREWDDAGNVVLCERWFDTQSREHGTRVTRYQDGSTETRCVFECGKLHGTVECFDTRGLPAYRGDYRRGVRVGVHTWWNNKSTVCSLEYNDAGVLHGRQVVTQSHVVRARARRRLLIFEAKDGLKHGIETMHEHAVLRVRRTYCEGKLHGLCEWFLPVFTPTTQHPLQGDPPVIARAEYCNGALNGRYTLMHLTRPHMTRVEMQFVNNQPTGLCYWWDVDGQLLEVSEYGHQQCTTTPELAAALKPIDGITLPMAVASTPRDNVTVIMRDPISQQRLKRALDDTPSSSMSAPGDDNDQDSADDASGDDDGGISSNAKPWIYTSDPVRLDFKWK